MTMVITGFRTVAPGTAAPGGGAEPGADWFDVKTALPGRGYKRLPRACQYLLAAAREAIAGAGDPLAGADPTRRAAVVGTNNAGARLLEELDRTIIDGHAGEMSPITAPFMAMSSFASRLSTEHAIKGFNLTTNSPRTAGLDAIGIAARALRAGRADVFVVGATEDDPPEDQRAGAADVGAAVLVCESAEAAAARGATVYGECRVRSFFLDPADPDTSVLAGSTCTDAVLDDSPVGRAVRAWAGRPREHRVEVDSGCFTPVRVLVDLLAAGGDGSRPRTLVTASAEGTVALVELVAPNPR
ncbi:beta-ketoacyl synthase N-terminal-like domain-containing protein [Saccharothrix sp. BKS2]|uniref:Beta-ketoacyl synthase N-terminal-like domain-containing protein n=1 Tax=Saccharothrix lopnurensis TaxID=1670621 RepID=A0ABW1P612_9PSEU